MANATLPTQPQIDYVRGLQRQLHLSSALLDLHCVRRFGVSFADLGRAQASDLIDELKHWVEIPAELQRAMGQRDLPGLDVRS